MRQLSGPQLHALFAKPPNSKGLCGSVEDQKAIISCIKNPDKCGPFLKILPHYLVLYPAIKTIHDLTDFSCVHHRLIALAYWLGGNQALAKVKKHPVNECLAIYSQNLLSAGVPKEYVAALIKNAPRSCFIPLHLYFVLLKARVDKLSNLDAISQCMTRAGSIQKIDRSNKTAVVSTFAISHNQSGRFVLVDEKVLVTFDLAKTPHIKGLSLYDLVSIHQGNICTKMTKQSATGLRIYSQRVIDIFNKG